MPRQSWLDDETQMPLIDNYARQLGSFMDAIADGKVEEAEVRAQEQRVVQMMKELEPQLDDAQHAKVTQLLCELTAYNLMQILETMQEARPVVKFRG
jgi:flagellin-specific chaperone FliS